MAFSSLDSSDDEDGGNAAKKKAVRTRAHTRCQGTFAFVFLRMSRARKFRLML